MWRKRKILLKYNIVRRIHLKDFQRLKIIIKKIHLKIRRKLNNKMGYKALLKSFEKEAYDEEKLKKLRCRRYNKTMKPQRME